MSRIDNTDFSGQTNPAEENPVVGQKQRLFSDCIRYRLHFAQFRLDIWLID
jgi:hypothetical protein